MAVTFWDLIFPKNSKMTKSEEYLVAKICRKQSNQFITVKKKSVNALLGQLFITQIVFNFKKLILQSAYNISLFFSVLGYLDRLFL